MRHLNEAEPKIEALVDHLQVREEDKDAQHWVRLIKAAFNAHPQHPGGMSGWASDNDSRDVEALQATFDSDHHMTRIWEPGVRNCVWNPIGIRFFTGPEDWSESRYRGVYTLAADSQTYVGYNKEWQNILVYHVVDEVGKV